MIRVPSAPEPASFGTKVRRRGLRALLELVASPSAPKRRGRPRKTTYGSLPEIPAEDLPPFWTACLEELKAAYNNTCAYLGMAIQPWSGGATVDHFRPKSKYRRHAYEWANFRLAARPVNTKKDTNEDVLDPFEVCDSWFVMNLGTAKLEAAPDLEPTLRGKVQATIERLDLNKETYRRARDEGHGRFLRGEITLTVLREDFPIVARQLELRGKLPGIAPTTSAPTPRK